jgi:hypothetical protein
VQPHGIAFQHSYNHSYILSNLDAVYCTNCVALDRSSELCTDGVTHTGADQPRRLKHAAAFARADGTADGCTNSHALTCANNAQPNRTSEVGAVIGTV